MLPESLNVLWLSKGCEMAPVLPLLQIFRDYCWEPGLSNGIKITEMYDWWDILFKANHG